MIRLEAAIDGVCQCIICGAKGDYRDMHAGHFISRKHSATAFDERNCNVCCVQCNVHEHGNLVEYYAVMRQIYGQETVDELRATARTLKTWTIEELQDMREYYRRRWKTAIQC